MKSTLKTAAEHRAAYRGKRSRSKYFTLITTSSDSFRYGIVARKTVGKSVERNRIKRVAREVLSESSRSGTNLVLVSERANGVSNDLLRADLERLLRRAD